MAYDENKLKQLETEYKNGLFPYEHYIEQKREIMGADFVDETAPDSPPQQTAAAAPPLPQKNVSELPLMNISEFKSLDYHVRVDDKEIGVFKRDALIEMARNGEIDKDALVYFEGIDNWIEAGNTPVIENHFPSVPPPGSNADKRRKAAKEAALRAEEQRKAEERRKAEEQRAAEERRKAEEQRKQDEIQREQERKIADEKRNIEEQRLIAERRRAEEQRRLDEEAKRAADAETARYKAETEAARQKTQAESARQNTYQPVYTNTGYDSDTSDKNQTVLIVLSVILGGLGVDRFYAGRLWLGIGKIISSIAGVGFIWWIIDAVLAIAGKQKDGDGYYIRGSVALPDALSSVISFLDRYKKVIIIAVIALGAILAGKILIDRVSSLSGKTQTQQTAESSTAAESKTETGKQQAAAPAPVVRRVQAETLMNGTHTFTPRLQSTRGGLPVHNIFIPQIIVTNEYLIIFTCSNATGYFRDGSSAYNSNVDWDPGVDGFFDAGSFTLQDLDNPSRTFRPLSAECTSNGMGKIWYITYPNIQTTRFKFSGKQYFSDQHEFIFEEIIMGEPDAGT